MSKLVEAIQSLLRQFGFDADASTIEGLVALVLLLVLLSLLTKVVSGIAGAGEWVKGQIAQKFWRNPEKVTMLITLVLLVIAYGFYGPQQERSLGRAVLDLGREQLLSVLPAAILTLWVLQVGLWFLFGSLMKMSRTNLLYPIRELAFVIVFLVQFVCFAIAVAALVGKNHAVMWTALALLLPMGYFMVIVGPFTQVMAKQRRPDAPRWQVSLRATVSAPSCSYSSTCSSAVSSVASPVSSLR